MFTEHFPSFDEFVIVWQNASSAKEVSKVLLRKGFVVMNAREVLFWSKRMRKSGVRLKSFVRLRAIAAA